MLSCPLSHSDQVATTLFLLAWTRRGYDCSLNGVSDAVYQTKDSGKQIQGKHKLEKIRWLHARGKLPLPRHQAYGTILVKVKRCRDGINAKTGESVVVVRSRCASFGCRKAARPLLTFYVLQDLVCCRC